MWHNLIVLNTEQGGRSMGDSMGDSMGNKNPNTTSYEDMMLVAFLKLKGFIVVPWVDRNNTADTRVSFDIQGDENEIEAAVNAFYANEQIGIQDFCKSFKETKSNMHALKRVGKS